MHRLVVALLLLAGSARAAIDPAAIDDLAAKALKDFDAPGCVIVIVQNDQVTHLKGYGVRELGKPETVTPDTVFAIASCTKAFTSTAAAILVGEGKLAWDDSVRKHIPDFRLSDALADREVTVRDLLCHRTGMPRHDWLWLDADLTPDDLVRRFGRAKPSTSFRSAWEYSNVPFVAAGEVMEKVTGKPWAEVIKTRLFVPLGMTGATCSEAEVERVTDRASPHPPDVDGKVRPSPWDPLPLALGAGAINATGRDLGPWLRFQLGDGTFDGKRLVAASAFKETHTAQTVVRQEGRFATFYPPKCTDLLTYGLGWFVHDHRGHLSISHGGTLNGFRAHVMLAPKSKSGVAVLVNRGNTFFPEAVAKAIFERLVGLPPEDWVGYFVGRQREQDAQTKTARQKRIDGRKPYTKPTHDLTAYAGNYDETAYGRCILRVEDGVLTLAWGPRVFKLEHYHFDTFTAIAAAPERLKKSLEGFDELVTFRLGSDGEVEGLSFLGQFFRRVKK